MEKSLWRRVRVNKFLLFPFFAAVVAMTYDDGSASVIGGLPGAYLRMPVGAAATAMGGAWTASPDYYLSWWNPASLGFLRERRLAAGTGIRSLGRMEGYGSYDFRVPPRVAMRLFALYRGDPFLDNLKDYYDNELPGAAYTTLTLKSAIGYYLSRKLAAGIAVNVLHQSLPTYGNDGGIQYASATGIGAIDAAIVYRATNALTVAAAVQFMGANMEWAMGESSPMVEDKPLPGFTIASSYQTTLAGKPLLWALDCKGYLFDGSWRRLDRPEAVIHTGAEWRRWENWYLRAGLGDAALNGDLLGDSERFFKDFTMRITAGFGHELTKVKKGLWLNYCVATDKVWAGIDQQLDITMSF